MSKNLISRRGLLASSGYLAGGALLLGRSARAEDLLGFKTEQKKSHRGPVYQRVRFQMAEGIMVSAN